MLPGSSPDRPRSHSPPGRFVPPLLLRFNLASLLGAWFVQSLLLLSASKTAGVTHWKLIDNEIIPEPPDLDTPGELEAQSEGGPKQDSAAVYSINQVSSSDPEFSMLVRYSARNSGGGAGSPNRGGGGYGIYQRQGTAVPDSRCSGAGNVEGDCPGNGEDGGADKGKTRQPRNPDGSGPM